MVNKKDQDARGSIFYVYLHVDRNGSVVYVGKGSAGRAWDARPTTRGNNGGAEQHHAWMSERILNEEEFVEMVATKLTNRQALVLESSIKEYLIPKFNFKLKK